MYMGNKQVADHSRDECSHDTSHRRARRVIVSSTSSYFVSVAKSVILKQVASHKKYYRASSNLEIITSIRVP